MTSPLFKSVVLCLCFSVVLSSAARQKQGEILSSRERRQKLYPEFVRTFDLAEAAPAPLRALALIRIASFPMNKDEEWKRELLEESFEAAAQSPLRWPVAYVAFPQGPYQKAAASSAKEPNTVERLSLLRFLKDLTRFDFSGGQVCD